MQIANGSNVYVFYSTPACYGYAINKERPAGWEQKEDDFMPYDFVHSSLIHNILVLVSTARPQAAIIHIHTL